MSVWWLVSSELSAGAHPNLFLDVADFSGVRKGMFFDGVAVGSGLRLGVGIGSWIGLKGGLTGSESVVGGRDSDGFKGIFSLFPLEELLRRKNLKSFTILQSMCEYTEIRIQKN